jgi:menaquinone-dependent protoporphyrinogen oxidase
VFDGWKRSGAGEFCGNLVSPGADMFRVAPDARVRGLDTFDAVIVGSALYSNRWTGRAVRYVNHHVNQLRRVPVWFFSSGPLDDSADREDIAATSRRGSLPFR